MSRKPQVIAQKSVRDYIDRINGEVINFRTFQVREWKGKYYFEKAFIRILPDGTVHAPLDFAPTAREAEAIQKEWKEADLPKSIPARSTRGIKVLNDLSVLYQFFNKDGLITFVQERTTPKQYLPWSFWSDGEWRQMQPDGPIPFWKPKRVAKYNPRNKVMIHEGAKAADAAWQLKKDHPWYREFDDYEHWGLVGGALAVNRADYADLREFKPAEVVYVCDNDHPGRSMLQWMSRNYGAKLKGVVFDRDFPESWDLADPLPKEFFEGDRFVGKPFSQYKKPATFATVTLQPNDKREKAKTVASSFFLEEWYHVVRPEVFIHRDYPDRQYTPKEFDNFIAPFSAASETHKLIVRDDAGKGTTLAYHPGRDPGFYASSEGHMINTHRPPEFIPFEKKPTLKDVKPFIDFMDHLVPREEDRDQLMRWCATLVAQPGTKMHYGVLLISETQGVGKGTLGEKILSPLVGLGNTSFPSEEDITDSNYNYWSSHKRLAVVHEIYAGHSSKAYNKLKSIITDKNVMVKRKYMADYTVENWTHIFASSNSPRALRLSMDDRRWLVPKVSEEKQRTEYWKGFHHWLSRQNGLEYIKWYFETQFEGRYIPTGQDAPDTAVKREVIEEGFSEGQKIAYNVLQEAMELAKVEGRDLLVADSDVVKCIRYELYDGKRHDKLERPGTIRTIARGLGWFSHGERIKNAKWKMDTQPSRILCTSKVDAERPSKDLIGRDLYDIFAAAKKREEL